MVRATRSIRSRRSGGNNGDDRRDHDHDHDRDHRREHERERYDDPEEHREIERRRFHGGLPPTPERYALAREQWYRLPGALVRPTMSTTGGDTNPGDTGAGDTGAGDRKPDQ